MNDPLIIDVAFCPVEVGDHGAAQREDHQVVGDGDHVGHDDQTSTYATQVPATADRGDPVENMAAKGPKVNGAAPAASRCLVLAASGNPRDRELAGLAAEINQDHDSYRRGARTTFQYARAAGEKLLRVKEIVGHGQWIDWVEENCDFSARTAQQYVRIARRCRDLGENAQLPAHLTIEAVLEVFALPHSALANGSTAVADYLDAGAESDQRQLGAHDEDRTDASKQVKSTKKPGRNRQPGGGPPGSDAPPAIPSASRKKPQKDRAKQHQDYCRRLRKLSAAGTTPESQIVTDRVNAGIGAVLRVVRRVLLDYGKRQCNLAARNQGIDPVLMAMAIAKALKNRLDPRELFKPK